MQKNINNQFSGFTPLSTEEMDQINGGDGFWETVGYSIGMIVKTFYVVTKAAAEYQTSLPPNLKK